MLPYHWSAFDVKLTAKSPESMAVSSISTAASSGGSTIMRKSDLI